MSKYKVIKPFYDVNHHVNYFVDEGYPKGEFETSTSRLEELTSRSNNIGVPLIEEIKKNTKK